MTVSAIVRRIDDVGLYSCLLKHLKKAAPGVLGSEGIKWNFTKFLVDSNGNVVRRYAPKDKPSAIAKDIDALLA